MNLLRKRLLALVLSSLGIVPALAATYYVDVVGGSDALSGSATTVSGTSGPWRTLTRVGSAALQPGDVVRLKCGQRWNETLRIASSGAAGNPITVNAYPDGCTTAPAVDGAESVPADQWQRHSGSIYKVQFPLSLIRNGNLSERATNWRYYSSPGDSSAGYLDGCGGEGFGCMQFITSSGLSDSLLISPAFAVSAGTNYQLQARIKVPLGQAYFFYLRKNSAPWSVPGLAPVKRLGTGAWEDVAMNFTAGDSATNARIDIGVPGARQTVLLRELRLTTGSADTAVAQVFEGADPITVAHHPNLGHDSTKPESMYLNTGGSSAVVTDASGRPGSNYFVAAANEKLPPGATVAVGTKVFIRTQNWSLGEYSVTGVSANRVSISPNSAHPLSYPGWGYFYTGALWMLDSPGEWYYDEASRTLYVWTSTGAAPGAELTYSRLNQAADLFGRANISIQGVNFRNASYGIEASRSSNITLSSVGVHNTAGYGINGAGSNGLTITGSVFRNNLTDAVQAPNATSMSLVGSDIEDTGVVVKPDGRVVSLPAPSYGAVSSGAKSVIRDNRVRNASYVGIAVGNDSVVSNNSVETYCLVLNDCGGLYTYGTARVLIENNYVLEGRGTRYGIPAVLNTHTNALYFDRGTNNSIVRGNTLVGSDAGMQLHDSYNNTIENNKFFGNKGQQFWLQQSDRDFNTTLGNVFGNVVRNNQFFPTRTAPAVFQQGRTADPAVFGTYDGNRYSTLLSPLVVSEVGSTGSRMYQFADWQAAVGSQGARGLDTNGRVAAPNSGRALGRMGANLVSNGLLATDTAGWTRGGSPAPSVTYGSCPDGSNNCINVAAAGGDGMLSSPRFPIAAGAWYRVSFDAAVGTAGQPVNVLVRRAGPNYDSVMGDALSFPGSTVFKRYSFVIKATVGAPISATESGARVDFFGVKTGQKLTVTNLELVPINNVAGGDNQFVLLANTGRAVLNLACPVTDATTCASYLNFADGLPVSWPVMLQPLQTAIVFAQDSALPDSDGDGVADLQDRCPGTAAGAATNSAGCARGQ